MDNVTQASLAITHGSSPLLLPMLLAECIAFIVLVVLLYRNLIVFWKGRLDAAGLERLRLRLLVCKRIAIAAMLIVVFQVYNEMVFLFFIISTGISLEGLSNYFSWQTYPVFFGILIMSFGMIQYLIIDTIRQYKSSSHEKSL